MRFAGDSFVYEALVNDRENTFLTWIKISYPQFMADISLHGDGFRTCAVRHMQRKFLIYCLRCAMP